jgi:hypothetical protein
MPAGKKLKQRHLTLIADAKTAPGNHDMVTRKRHKAIIILVIPVVRSIIDKAESVKTASNTLERTLLVGS